MICMVSAFSFFIIIIYFSFPITKANRPVDDNMLIAFLKGNQATQISKYSKQKYDAYLGIVYFLREKWQCDQIGEKFEEFERTECQKYRKYLNILYEYLFREYVGIATVKPKFVIKDIKEEQFEIEGSIIYVVNCLFKISQFFYFKSHWSNYYEYKLNKLFTRNQDSVFEPILLNEKRLNYELKNKNERKVPINEMVLQLAIDTANECQTTESAEGIITRRNFEEFEKMLKNADNSTNKILNANEINEMMTLNSKFDDSQKWIEDALFSEFVKGQATNLDKFNKHFKNYSELKKYSTKYKSNLCAVYLMSVEKLRCNKICQIKNNNCQKYRKHSHILYDYLFGVYVEAKSPNLSRQLPPVKPIFCGCSTDSKTQNLINVVNNLYYVAKFCCKERFGKTAKNYPMELLNEKDFNYDEIKENENGKTKKQILNEPTEIEKIRMEFGQKLEKMC